MRPSSKLALLAAAGATALLRRLLSNGEFPAAAVEESRRRSGAAKLKRQWWTIAKYFAVFLVVLGVGGFLVAASGIIPIKASSGHWAITSWFLQFSKSRSVATHTVGLKAPSLDEPRLALQGAGAYETNCRACHGSPELRSPRVAQAMTPHPPYLPETIPKWESAELFYIVKHGIKFTGMPAWPAQGRDDEVWAMVAFLRRLPHLDAGEYRRLVSGEAQTNGGAVAPLAGLLGSADVPDAITKSCARCHGVDGLGRGVGAFPKLAGQSAEYFYRSLQAYARRERHSGIMEPHAVGLSDGEMRELSSYYSSLPQFSPPTPAPDMFPALERGETIARQGIPAQRVPSCVACHGPAHAPRNPVYPDLRGQYADYLAQQLELFKAKKRGGTPYAHLMHPVAERLTPEQMRDVALYFASLASGSETPPAR